jgi:hypothetical protein
VAILWWDAEINKEQDKTRKEEHDDPAQRSNLNSEES